MGNIVQRRAKKNSSKEQCQEMIYERTEFLETVWKHHALQIKIGKLVVAHVIQLQLDENAKLKTRELKANF
jgi:hypothetical protein